MALTSARFNSDDALHKIAVPFGGSLQKGSQGKAVHLVQMALLDLGIPLPRSTTNPQYSPDGDYGDDPEQAVRQFQKTRPGLTVDGKVGEKTLKELDARFANFSHEIRLHFRWIVRRTYRFSAASRMPRSCSGNGASPPSSARPNRSTCRRRLGSSAGAKRATGT